MRITWHQLVNVLSRLAQHTFNRRMHLPLRLFYRRHQPQVNISLYLIISRACRVQLATVGADQFAKTSLICGVYVFVHILHFKLTRLPLLGNVVQAPSNPVQFRVS